MIINLEDNLVGFDRYNGGWVKTVTGLDKDVTNGYSIKGDFVAGKNVKNVELKEGTLYLDCSISGSRKNQVKDYHLFKFEDGEIDVIKTIEDGQEDWAVQLWDDIELELDIIPSNIDIIKQRINKLSDKEYAQLLDDLRMNDKRFQLLQALYMANFLAEYKNNPEEYDREIEYLMEKGKI